MNRHFLYYFLAIIFIFNTGVFAQETETVLYRDVMMAKNNMSFNDVQLFSIQNGVPATGALTEETILAIDNDAAILAYETKKRGISLHLQDRHGKTYQLNMLRSSPLAYQPTVTYQDETGKHPFAYDAGVHYQGAVAGQPHSLAAMSVFATGEVMILFANDEGNFVIGKLEDGSGNYVLYNDKDFINKPDIPCGTTDEGIIIPEDEPTDGGKTTTAYECNKIGLYWEGNYVLYQDKSSSVTNTQAYLVALFNQVQALYRNEEIAIELRSVNIWTVDDNYPSNSSHDALTAFASRWNQNGQTFDGDLATLIAKDPGGNGGVAFRGGLCSKSYPYAYGDVNGTVLAVPNYSWDVQMITHEIGHNIASPHTHWCGWKTGAGGACGAIDNCASFEPGAGCSTCPVSYSNSAPTSAWQGTVMSYCHLRSRGINLANGFGPLPGQMMRDAVSSLSCLKSIISAKLTATDVCKDYGTITLTFDSTGIIGNNNFGALAYSYQWSAGNVITKDITVTKAGNYTVKVTDANGCTIDLSVNVLQDNAPDCLTTGINDIERSHVSIYPNPAKDKAVIKLFGSTAEETIIKVMDVTGKVIKVQTANTTVGENNITLDISGLNSGMYYVTLTATSSNYVSLKLLVD